MEFLTAENLKCYFPAGRAGLMGEPRYVHAVDGVSFSLGGRETLGLVGESGCGKSTLGRTVLKLYEPQAGSIRFRGEDITRYTPDQMKPLRKQLQMVFQDPFASLNPRMTVGQIVGEPLIVHGLARGEKERSARVETLLETVGLRSGDRTKYPSELSGGQRQRIMIAKVLATKPEFVVADEAVSALDVSIRAQILNLLRDVQEEFGISYLFISHDVGVVTFISDRIAVMYLGMIVETAATNELVTHPFHPYTKNLLDSVPRIGESAVERTRIRGEVASAVTPPPGCRFCPRCPVALPVCRTEVPVPRLVAPGHWAACHLASGAQA